MKIKFKYLIIIGLLFSFFSGMTAVAKVQGKVKHIEYDGIPVNYELQIFYCNMTVPGLKPLSFKFNKEESYNVKTIGDESQDFTINSNHSTNETAATIKYCFYTQPDLLSLLYGSKKAVLTYDVYTKKDDKEIEIGKLTLTQRYDITNYLYVIPSPIVKFTRTDNSSRIAIASYPGDRMGDQCMFGDTLTAWYPENNYCKSGERLRLQDYVNVRVDDNGIAWYNYKEVKTNWKDDADDLFIRNIIQIGQEEDSPQTSIENL